MWEQLFVRMTGGRVAHQQKQQQQQQPKQRQTATEKETNAHKYDEKHKPNTTNVVMAIKINKNGNEQDNYRAHKRARWIFE